MILGRGKQDGDQSISLNLDGVAESDAGVATTHSANKHRIFNEDPVPPPLSFFSLLFPSVGTHSSVTPCVILSRPHHFFALPKHVYLKFSVKPVHAQICFHVGVRTPIYFLAREQRRASSNLAVSSLRWGSHVHFGHD